MSVVISHAVANKDLVNKFVDLLQTGMNIPHDQIFCSSLEGLGIPGGKNFVTFIREQVADAEFVISVITPSYYESAFCLCELGATWITGQEAFPLLVPPLSFDDLKAVLVGVQSGAINDKAVLNQLFDRLKAVGLTKVTSTGRWEVKRDEFLRSLPAILKKLPGPTKVSVDVHKATQEAYEAAQDTIQEKNTRIEELEAMIEELKLCKDRTEVAKVVRKASGAQAEFEQLVADFKQAIRELPKVAIEAMYYEIREESFVPNSDWGNATDWDAIRDAVERGFVTRDDPQVILNGDHPQAKKAMAKLRELREFMQRPTTAVLSSPFEERGCPFDILNRDFWEILVRRDRPWG